MARSKKQQTQLAFMPLSPDSPASRSQPAATRSRSAAVAISPSRKSTSKAKITGSFLPTPAASSQLALNSKSSSQPETMPTSKKLRKTPLMTRSSVPRSSPLPLSTLKENLNSDIIDMFDESESDEQAVLSAATPRRRRVRASSTNDSDDNDAATVSPRSRRTKRQTRASPDFINDDDEQESPSASEVEQPQPKRRRLIGPKTPRKSVGEREDLQEDLDFLKSDEPDDGPGRYVSSQHSAKRQGKLSALEQLKKSRQKNATPARRPRTQVIEDDEDVSAGSDVSDHNEPANSDSDDLEIIEAAPHVAETNEDSFIVEDDDDAAEIPLEMRMNLMKDKELFEFAVEWMCQKRLNPAFAYDDDVYATAFRRLDDSMKGLAGSKFQSSAWTAAFTRAIKARPVLEEEHFINDGLHDRCDACNRSRHPPTWRVWLQGDPYNLHTLEDESEGEANRGRETKIPKTSTTWYLGRFCMANAKSTHTLAHWRYHLYQWVNEYLDDEGYLEPAKVIERDRWSTKKKRDYANQVVDEMKANGVVNRLFKDFKDEKDQAQRGNEEDYALD